MIDYRLRDHIIVFPQGMRQHDKGKELAKALKKFPLT